MGLQQKRKESSSPSSDKSSERPAKQPRRSTPENTDGDIGEGSVSSPLQSNGVADIDLAEDDGVLDNPVHQQMAFDDADDNDEDFLDGGILLDYEVVEDDNGIPDEDKEDVENGGVSLVDSSIEVGNGEPTIGHQDKSPPLKLPAGVTQKEWGTYRITTAHSQTRYPAARCILSSAIAMTCLTYQNKS